MIVAVLVAIYLVVGGVCAGITYKVARAGGHSEGESQRAGIIVIFVWPILVGIAVGYVIWGWRQARKQEAQ